MTNEEAIKELSVVYLGDSERIRKAKKIAIKAIKQMDALDKIRAEFGSKADNSNDWITDGLIWEEAIDIIDKYRKEQK